MSAWLALLFQLASYAPPQAADHVVRLEIVEGHGSSSSDRTVVYRSGRHMRTESRDPFRSQSSFFDLATGLQASILRGPQGEVQRAWIERAYDRTSRLPPTGRRDRMLGESCTIWRLTTENRGSGTEICETGDGILLRQAFWYRPSERTVEYMRATAVERRPVRPEEVLPPRDLLALAEAPPDAASAPSGASADYEVEMVGDDPADGSYVRRNHGRYWSENGVDRDGMRRLHFSNGAVSTTYVEDEAGRPSSLNIERAGARFPIRLASRWERVPGRAPERVVGETCTWQNNAAIESNDRQYYCRTAEGIALRTESWFHWTNRTERFTARRLSRRPLTDADFAIPARALDWAHWGLTPAP